MKKIIFLVFIIFISCIKSYDEIRYIDIKSEKIETEMRNIINEAIKADTVSKLSTLEERKNQLGLKILNNLTLSLVNYSKDITSTDNEKNREKYSGQYYLFEKLEKEFYLTIQTNKNGKKFLEKEHFLNCSNLEEDFKINLVELEKLKNSREDLVMKYNLLNNELNNKFSLEDIDKINDEELKIKLKNDFYRENSGKFMLLLKEIIEIDKKMAEIREYKNPIEMYYFDYNRTYDYEDSLEMAEITKEYFAPLLNYKLSFDTKYKIEDSIESYPEVLYLYNKNMLDVWNIMKKKKLYDIKQSTLKEQANFVTYFPKDKVPYLIMNSSDRDTLFVLSHEFAHFYDIWINKGEMSSSAEIREMFGQINPVFLMINLEKIYKDSDYAEKVRDQMLYNYVSMMVNNAITEKFFIYLYQADNIDLENTTQLFSEIWNEFYGNNEKDYSWYTKIGIERPFYDIDYWRGTHIALQTFFMANENEKEAAAIFEDMIKSDKCLSFEELIKKTPFSDTLDKEEANKINKKLDKIFSKYKN